MSGQTEIWRNIKVQGFKPQSKCPQCDAPLIVHSLIVAVFPYPHVDLSLKCSFCSETKEMDYTFGIPIDKVSGLGTIIYDTQSLKKLREVTQYIVGADGLPPTCDFCRKEMSLTKVFGDLVYKIKKSFRIQFKCRKCYLVKHFQIPDLKNYLITRKIKKKS